MSVRQVTVYDPAMCCPTGVCGPDIDPALIHVAADLEWLGEQGVTVVRYNLAQEPGAFAENALVRDALHAHGDAALPMVLVDGRVVLSGSYPTREQLAGWVGLRSGPRFKVASGCDPKTGCC